MPTINDIPTPSLVVDLSVAHRNIKRVADYAAKHRLNLRPHAKTHKSLTIGRAQMQAGATGLALAKISEAAVMASVSDDILITSPVWDSARSRDIAKLAGDITLRVAVDSSAAVDALTQAARDMGTTIGFLVEIDVGCRRTGVASPEDALALAEHIDRSGGARLDGIEVYPGHINQRPDEQAPALRSVAEIIARTGQLWRERGLNMNIVSGGSTPTALRSHLIEGLTEMRPGTYVYNDRNYLSGGFCEIDDCAAKVVSMVMSNAVAGQVVIDAGSKALSAERLGSCGAEGGFGLVVGYPEAKIVKLNEEHGYVDITRCPNPPSLGERVWVIPNHICPCVNLHENAWSTTDGHGVEPLRPEARGKLW